MGPSETSKSLQAKEAELRALKQKLQKAEAEIAALQEKERDLGVRACCITP